MKTESEEQINFIQWCKRNVEEYPQLDKIFAIPNGGLRNKLTASRLKLEGVKSGVPDLFLPVAGNNFHGLFIEMKRLKGGVLSTNQKKWKLLLEEENYLVEVAKGFEEAKKIIIDYLEQQ